MTSLKAERAAATPSTDPVESGATRDLSLDFLAPPAQPQNLGRLAEYEVIEVLGRGGMGIVFKAYDAQLARLVAIKVLHPHLAIHPSSRKRFSREARALAALRHPNVVAIHQVGEIRDIPYLVMEYVDGCSVHERLARAAPPQVEEILQIGMQVASALAAAHALGIIHRDIKPANLLLESGSGQVQLTDFGLARALDDASLTQSGLLAGTPEYMAPEQARGERPDQRADLFSLGTVLYALCTGSSPFRADNSMAVLCKISVDTPTPVHEVRPDLPAWLSAIVAKLHAKDPAERFQSADEVTQVLTQCLAHVREPSAPLPQFLIEASGTTQKGGTTMALIACEECGKQISDKAYSCPHCGIRRIFGYEYRSTLNFLGLPLVHIVGGRDLVTGQLRTAKGIIAIGQRAIGVLALGGQAFGVIAVGGWSIGIVALGGMSIGLLLAIGGFAVGGIAMGGVSLGVVAIGGLAMGHYALGGLAFGSHAVFENHIDQEGLTFFRTWFGRWVDLMVGRR
jgi:serine/threonine protein kinase